MPKEAYISVDELEEEYNHFRTKNRDLFSGGGIFGVELFWMGDAPAGAAVLLNEIAPRPQPVDQRRGSSIILLPLRCCCQRGVVGQ